MIGYVRQAAAQVLAVYAAIAIGIWGTACRPVVPDPFDRFLEQRPEARVQFVYEDIERFTPAPSWERQFFRLSDCVAQIAGMPSRVAALWEDLEFYEVDNLWVLNERTYTGYGARGMFLEPATIVLERGYTSEVVAHEMLHFILPPKVGDGPAHRLAMSVCGRA